MKPIRVIIADDHEMFRAGLRSLLQGLPEVDVIAEAEGGRTAVQLSRELSPDVVIMDFAMPDLNGIDATRQISGSAHGPKVIALSGLATPHAATEMLAAGASGFVRKESAFNELADAIHSVMNSRVYISPALAETMMEEKQHAANGANHRRTSLSGREREVLQMIADGKCTKEVAMELRLSVKTIETHRRNLMEKLQLFSVAELTKYALREGLTCG